MKRRLQGALCALALCLGALHGMCWRQALGMEENLFWTETPAPAQGSFAIEVLGSEIARPRPRVLIYHTHSYEAYAQVADALYVETTQWRTEDASHNIMAVGARLKQELEAEKQNKSNRARSLGSQKDSGGRKQKSEFEEFENALFG